MQQHGSEVDSAHEKQVAALQNTIDEQIASAEEARGEML